VPVRDTQTDRQTNSAENNGPSGLQSGQQTDRRTGEFTFAKKTFLKIYFNIEPQLNAVKYN